MVFVDNGILLSYQKRTSKPSVATQTELNGVMISRIAPKEKDKTTWCHF